MVLTVRLGESTDFGAVPHSRREDAAGLHPDDNEKSPTNGDYRRRRTPLQVKRELKTRLRQPAAGQPNGAVRRQPLTRRPVLRKGYGIIVVEERDQAEANDSSVSCCSAVRTGADDSSRVCLRDACKIIDDTLLTHVADGVAYRPTSTMSTAATSSGAPWERACASTQRGSSPKAAHFESRSSAESNSAM